MKLPKNITLDAKTGEVTIDGKALGLYLACEDVDVTAVEGGCWSVVRLPLLAESVTILPRDRDDDGAQ